MKSWQVIDYVEEANRLLLMFSIGFQSHTIYIFTFIVVKF